jgi:hypothetical protein
MDQEAADELVGRKQQCLLAVVVPVILPTKADLAVIHRHQTVVGDGNPVGIAPDILENLSRSGEWPLRVDDPLGVVDRRQVVPKCRGLLQVTMCGKEA